MHYHWSTSPQAISSPPTSSSSGSSSSPAPLSLSGPSRWEGSQGGPRRESKLDQGRVRGHQHVRLVALYCPLDGAKTGLPDNGSRAVIDLMSKLDFSLSPGLGTRAGLEAGEQCRGVLIYM